MSNQPSEKDYGFYIAFTCVLLFGTVVIIGMAKNYNIRDIITLAAVFTAWINAIIFYYFGAKQVQNYMKSTKTLKLDLVLRPGDSSLPIATG
jgi:hypothetical protein